MATSRTGPSVNWKEAGSDIWSLMLDTARHKLIDVEMVGDEMNRADMTDLRTGQGVGQVGTGTASPQVQSSFGLPGGNGMLALVAVAAVAGGLVWYMAD